MQNLEDWIFHHLQYIISSKYSEKEYKEQGSKSVFDACDLRAFRQCGIKSKQSTVEISDQEHYQKITLCEHSSQMQIHPQMQFKARMSKLSPLDISRLQSTEFCFLTAPNSSA